MAAPSQQTFALPDDLPVPPATQAALHLAGHPLPPLIELPSTSGGYVDLFLLSLRRPVLLFLYPRTAAPDEQVPADWNAIPGARGCTPHLSNVRDYYQILLDRESVGGKTGDDNSNDDDDKLAIFGLSTQSSAYQREAAERLQLPFPLLSDESLALQRALDLPTFTWREQTFLERCTLLLRDGQVTQVQHPVFPPNRAAQEALKMLDAGKPTTTTTTLKSESMNEAYDASSVSNGSRRAATEMGDDAWTSSSRRLPKPRDLTGSIRSFKGLERAALSRQMDWRNSLVAVDTCTGEVVGVLAHGVSLSDAAAASHEPTPPAASPLSDEDEDEIPTPNTPGTAPSVFRSSAAYFDKDVNTDRTTAQLPPPPLLAYTAAATYHDPDVRPRSREGSVLGEDTFAPPPVPDKGEASVLRPSASADGALSEDDSSDDGGMSDGEAIDGRVRTRAKHVEQHQPDLLREHDDDSDDAASDVSGSTVGGPAVQLWRKARGGKQGEAKRQAKKQAKQDARTAAEEAKAAEQKALRERRAMVSEAPVTVAAKDIPSALPPTAMEQAAPTTSLQPPTNETVNVARQHRARRQQMATSEVRDIENNVWQSALESGSLPIDAPYTHQSAAWDMVARGQEALQKRVADVGLGAQRALGMPMQGNSVLIEFLAGSRIAASVIHDAANHLLSQEATAGAAMSQNAAVARAGPDAFSPTHLANVAQTGALRYIPVLPSHLLWFFGIGGEESKTSAQSATATLAQATTAAKEAAAATAALPGNVVYNVALMGGDLVRLVTAPVQLLDVATRGVSAAWGGMSSLGGEASNWIGAGLAYLTGGSTGNAEQDDWRTTQPGDEDASEWEWRVPQYGEESLANTPRPVYRRKRPVPSMYGGFSVRQMGDDRAMETDDVDRLLLNGNLTIHRGAESSRYSIVHFDHEGVGRQAVLSAGLAK